MSKLALLAAATVTFLGSVASGQTCPASIVTGDGIGDGCTTTYKGTSLADIPQIGIFRSDFTPACNGHDKCLTTLGTTVGECNGNFLADMLSSCQAHYLPFRADVYLACVSSASAYRAAVDLYLLSLDPSSVPGHQSDAALVSRSLQSAIEADRCGTTPERTTLYSPNLISHINSTFQTYAGRSPTIYEFLDAINTPDYSGGSLFVSDRGTWESRLVSLAQFAASVQPPLANISISGGRANSAIVFYPDPPVSGAAYLWRISATGAETGPRPDSIAYYFNPVYDTTYRFNGFVKVTSAAGVRNMSLIDTQVRVTGSCAPSPKYKCY